MKNLWRNRLLLFALATLTVCFAAPAWAADCGDTSGPGGTDVPCACGDTVTTDTVLELDEPVTTEVCAANGGLLDVAGLTVADGITLEMSARTIRGQHLVNGACDGVGIGLGADASVKNGRLVGFDIGVAGSSGGTVSVVHVLDSCLRGMTFAGDGNRLEKNIVLRTDAQGGINVSGDDNIITLNRVEDSAVGILADGSRNEVSRNLVYRSGSGGIDVSGAAATVNLNQVKFTSGNGLTLFGSEHSASRNISSDNVADGFVLGGSGHTTSRNISERNGGDGFDVSAAASTFSSNNGRYNGGWGIRDRTSGNGTGGTANTYTGNACSRNGLGNSLPPGLC